MEMGSRSLIRKLCGYPLINVLAVLTFVAVAIAPLSAFAEPGDAEVRLNASANGDLSWDEDWVDSLVQSTPWK